MSPAPPKDTDRRSATIARKTKETDIHVELALDRIFDGYD